jgi:hypothetical protein
MTDQKTEQEQALRNGELVNQGLCVNGDGNPICPPSRVICRACLDRIGDTLRQMAANWKSDD